jgi:nicotinate phosphoribosyltransferase
MGTMPHALILILGDTVEALKAFHEVIEPKVKRVALIDTLTDEKFEAVRVAEALGRDLYAVRLDTPSSRRGDFLKILREVRWELDLRGYHHVRLFVSGGIDEPQITELNPLVDAYGVGTSISNAPVIDFAMDIIEIEGKPFAKRGKWSGSKRVLRCPECFQSEIVPYQTVKDLCPKPGCGGRLEELLMPILKEGKMLSDSASPAQIRHYVMEQLQHFQIAA